MTDQRRWLPLYEAKMLSHYDHRHATFSGATQAQLNKGTLPRLPDGDHMDPSAEPLARYWVADDEIERAMGERWDRGWLLGWRGIGRASDARTFIPAAIPRAAVSGKFALAFSARASTLPLLQAVLSSLAFDFVVRQKLAGTDLAFFIVRQIACPTPETFDQPAPWQPEITLAEYITPRVIELTYTSHKMAPYARDFGYDGPPFPWC